MGLTSLAYLEAAKDERKKKMSAGEAKAASSKRAEELRQQRDEAEQKRAEAQAKKWRDQRADWYKSELESIEERIAEAIDKGKDSIEVWLATRDKREDAEEKSFWSGFAYKDELKKILAIFKKRGYKLKITVKPHENVDLSDLSPRDNWYTYESTLEISW